MVKLSVVFIFLIMFMLVPFSSSASDFAYNRLYSNSQPIDGFNYSINVNHSIFTDSWITPSLGLLTDVNPSQFDNIAGTLTIDESHIELIGNDWWLRRDGTNSPTADIDWDNNSLSDIYILNVNEEINIEFDDSNFENSSINIINNNPFGISSQRFANSRGDEFFVSLLGYDLSQVLFGDIIGENDSAMGLSGDGALFLATLNNNPIIIGSSPNDSIPDTDFFLRINPELQSLEIQGNKFIRPVITDGVQSMIFESNVGAADGEITFGFIGSDSENNSVAQSIFQIGKNHSASIQGMNSQIVAPKGFLTMPENVKAQFENNTGDPIIEEWFSNITSCLVYEEYLQGLAGFDFIERGLSSVCDTVSQGVPTSILGYVESVGPITAHGGTTIFDSLNYIGNKGNDVNIIFNGGLENGKLHIEDNRQIIANITFFNFLIADFDSGTISPFVSETISSEVGRDWRATLISPDECFNDNCATARGGVDKIMAFSASTTFEGGTVGSNNSRLLFYVTTNFAGNANISVTLDDNQGNVSLIYSETGMVSDDFINVSFPPEFESKANVTTRFILEASGGTNQVWIDEVRVNSEPNETIEINESYTGGKITLGDDSDPNFECYIERDKFIPNGSTSTANRMRLVCDHIDFVGNITQTHVTIENQTILGGSNITGDLTVGGSITLNDTTIGDWDEIVSNVTIMHGANESDLSGPAVPWLFTEEGVAKFEVVDGGSGSTIWEQVLSDIRNLNGNFLNFTGSIFASENITAGERFVQGNGLSYGYNATCKQIIYDENDNILEANFCS